MLFHLFIYLFKLYVEYYLNLPEISQIIAETLLLLQEVTRIKNEHPDDNHCIVNDRVKGRLKVTRAFGAGSLKQVCLILLSFPHSSICTISCTLVLKLQ